MKTISKILIEEEWEILDSGTFIHTKLNTPFTIQIVEDDGTEINARFVFKHNPNISDSFLNVEHYDIDTFQISLTHNGLLSNFGFVEPIEIGNYNNRRLKFNFRVDINNGSDSPLITYTWLINKISQK